MMKRVLARQVSEGETDYIKPPLSIYTSLYSGRRTPIGFQHDFSMILDNVISRYDGCLLAMSCSTHSAGHFQNQSVHFCSLITLCQIPRDKHQSFTRAVRAKRDETFCRRCR